MSDCRYEGKFIGQIEAVLAVGLFWGAAPHVSGPTGTDCIEHHRCPVDRPARGPSVVMFAVAIRGVCGVGGGATDQHERRRPNTSWGAVCAG